MISAIIAGSCSFFLGAFTFLKNPKTKLNQTFFLFSIAIALWNLTDFFVAIAPNDQKALFYYRLFNFSAPFIPFFCAIINFELIGKKLRDYKKFQWFSYFSLIFLFCIIPTKFYVEKVTRNPYVEYTGILYIYFVVYFLFVMAFPLVKVLLFYKKINNFLKKNQLKYTFLSIFVGLIAVVFYFVYMFHRNFIALHYYIEIIYLSIWSYAIIKHNLMDIDLAWRHSLKNIIYFLLFTASLVGIIFSILNNNKNIGILFAILSIILVYLKPKIDKFLYNIFLKKYRIIWHNLKEAGNIQDNIYETDTVIDILVFDISKALNIGTATYYRLDEAKQKYIPYQTNEKFEPGDILMNDDLDNKLLLHLLNKKSGINIHDLEDKELVALFNQMQIALCYPIFHQNTLIGILVYGNKRDNTVYNQEDLILLDETVRKAEQQISNIIKISHISNNYAEELLKKYKDTNQRMLLNETKRLSEFRDINLLCDHTKKVVQRLLNVKEVDIYLYDKVSERLYISTNADWTPKIEESNYLIKYLVQTNEIVSTADLKKWETDTKTKEFQEAAETAEKINARFIIPLTDKKLLGFLAIGNKFDLLEYTQDDFIFLSLIKNTLEITIRNIYLNEKSQRDPLTQIYNRNFLDARLEEEIVQSLREGIPVSVLMIDGDNFKWFNDNYNHDAGDRVLLAIVNCIKSTIRPTDEICRYGGEEFVILCTGTDNSGAEMLAKRINDEFKKNQDIVRLNERFNRKITVSIGISTFSPKKNRTNYINQEILEYCEILIKKSDEAMYKAKAAGKDTFFNYGEIKVFEDTNV